MTSTGGSPGPDGRIQEHPGSGDAMPLGRDPLARDPSDQELEPRRTEPDGAVSRRGGPGSETPAAEPVGADHGGETPTRASSVWTAAVAAVVLLLLLAVFVGQNSRNTEITFLAWHGHAPVAVLLLLAAVVGGALVAAAGVARILQLRRRRARSAPTTG